MKISEVPISVGATAVYPYNEGWASALTYISTYGDQVRMYRHHGNVIHVPRTMAVLDHLPAENDHRVKGDALPQIIPALKPRDADQQQVIDKSLMYLQKGIDHVIEAPTGFGKTFVGITLALAVSRPTLIVVTKEDLVHAWHKMIVNSPGADKEPGMGLSPAMVGHAQGKVLNYLGKRFVIGMIHSLVKADKYDQNFWRHFGLVIFDEVHRLGAETFQEVCHTVPAYHRLGLSATPTRKDGKDRVFHTHIGPVLVKGTTIPMHPRVLVRKTNCWVPKGVPMGPGSMTIANGILARNPVRNKLIVEFVLSALKAERRTVVMSDLVDGHLRLLFDLLCKSGVSGADIGFYIGQKGNAHKAKLALDDAKYKRVVLSTYTMTKEGTDVPEWDTLVLGTPRSDVEQAIGRIMRTMKGKKEPVVLDLVDGNPIFSNWHLSRLKQYYKVKSTVVNMHV